MARSLSPIQGGSNPRTLETTGKLQILQQVKIPSAGKGNINPEKKGSPVYVGTTPHVLDRLDEEQNEKEKKILHKKEKRDVRRVQDGLLLAVPTRISGKTNQRTS